MAEYCPPTASNFVCTGNIDYNLTIEHIAVLFSGKVSSAVFPCCTVIGADPRITYQVFRGGKLVISGASNEAEGHWGLVQFTARLSEFTNTHIRLRDFQAENIVAFGGLGFYFDQQAFFRDHQLASEPPQRFLFGAEGDLTPPPPKPGNRGKKRRKMHGATFSQFDASRFRGLQFFPRYPCVIILYSTGKYVVTGTNDPNEILRIVNCVDWSMYKLPDGVTLDQYHARLQAANRLRKRTAWGGFKCFDNTKLFSDVIWRAFVHSMTIKESKSKHKHA